MTGGRSPEDRSGGRDARKARLGEALRANLRRRKAQARGRDAPPPDEAGAGSAANDPGVGGADSAPRGPRDTGPGGGSRS